MFFLTIFSEEGGVGCNGCIFSNISSVNDDVSVNIGDVQLGAVTVNGRDQPNEVLMSVSEQATVSDNNLMTSGVNVMNVDMTASTEGLQANNVSDILCNDSTAALLGSARLQRDVSGTNVMFGNNIEKTSDIPGGNDNVADAFEHVSIFFVDLHKEINNVVSDNLVKQDEKTKLIKIGAEKDGTEVSVLKKENKARLLFGVMAGAFSENSMQAVNRSQLYFLSNQLAAQFGSGVGYKDGGWSISTSK
ncbi:Uncharacterised protein [Candidatus Bartonella washoeensis]|uniref:Trimeric autotransporter adhesin YadA-like stalk domain-containing protein n=1 Tax=Candidatus Bartonella washoeensis Sb944nv TaxID=1094563 RepID=J0YW80_9HYPH|nr:hypothetical protein [Bartonella washoeensis]EJF79378.1 hypothetical protein MCQ_00919 [Bartonella washoeensis Sb944nv]SPU27494.1 Uncharacterised protein [Bartonella washoeensis]